MRVLCFLFLFILFIMPGNCQKRDYIWLMGQNSQSNPIHSGTVIDYNTTPPDIYSEFRNMYFRQANASICDTVGNLLFYTNGLYIANALNEPMENGMGLNPGWFANQWEDSGYILEQGVIILPVPEQDSLYYLFHMDIDLNAEQTGAESRHFYYTLVNMNANGGLGRVITKNQIIQAGLFDIGKITACKDANGRDWWIVVRRLGINEYSRFLVTPKEIISYPALILGVQIPDSTGSLGQAVFSPDGTKYAKVNLPGYQGDPIYISIFDFDRCNGELSNPVQFTYADTAGAAGIAISPNSRFLYVSSVKYLYQYDLEASSIEESKITIAEWDGFSDPLHPALRTTFYMAQLGPDGKIYINSPSGVRYLHVINQPDSLGLACEVCQHCIQLPSLNSFSLPNFPNYRLHHLEGSPCDTLRQPPTALWSYEAQDPELAFQDSSFHDIRAWHWDFGDGATDTVPHPVHAYAVSGTYNVCLAVSNPRGADTLCREVQVIVNGLDETKGGISVRISPNPVGEAVTANLLADLGASANKFAATVSLRDALGQEVLREPLRVVDGQVRQELKIGHLASGVYFCVVESAGVVVWQGKIIKQ